MTVTIFTALVNSRVSRQINVKCKGSVIRGSEKADSVVDMKPDVVQRKINNLTSSKMAITSDVYLCYKTTISQNVSSEVQVKNLFIS